MRFLFTLALLSLTYQHPSFVAFFFLLKFVLDNLTDSDKQHLMTARNYVWSNGKRFLAFFKAKAIDLNIPLNDLRKQAVESLESNAFLRFLQPDELTQLFSHEELLEKASRYIRELLNTDEADPSSNWKDMSINDFIVSYCFDGIPLNDMPSDMQDAYFDSVTPVILQASPTFDFESPFTYKAYRQLKSKLKSLGKDHTGNIIDEQAHFDGIELVHILYQFFTNQPINISQFYAQHR